MKYKVFTHPASLNQTLRFGFGKFQLFSPLNAVLLLFFIAFGFKAIGQSNIEYNSSELSSKATKSLVINYPESGYCSSSMVRALVQVKLDFGADYTFGEHEVHGDVTFEITAYDAVSNGNVLFTKTGELSINNLQVENLWEYEISSFLPSVKRIEIKPINSSFTAPGSVLTSVNNSVRLIAGYQGSKKYNVANNNIVSAAPVKGNPTIFSWDNQGCEVYGYEFQLLRLYNTNDDYRHDPTKCKLVMDWSSALVMHLEGDETSLPLTLSEGSGYYAWRVRPIGNVYGGFGDSRDWGQWSGSAYIFMYDGYELTINSPSAVPEECIFYYDQFDEDKTFIHSRTLSEGNRMHESIKYANGLGNLRQTQAKLKSEDFMLMSQTLEDYSGRASIAAMGAPVNQESFGYKPKLLQNDGKLFGPEHYDEPNNYNNPDPINGGAVSDYYSNNNPDPTIPNAEGYAYVRTLFYQDGLNETKEQSGLGSTHKLKPNDQTSRTTKTLYATPSDIELIKIFGDEAPAATTVKKIITIDPNQVASVAYVDLQGRTIATCLTKSDLATSMDAISYSNATAIHHEITDNTYSGGSLFSTVDLSFTVPTEVTFNYSLTGKEVESLCADYCATCDYELLLIVKNLTTNTKDTIHREFFDALSCDDDVNLNILPVKRTLGFGNYEVVKVISPNNLNPNVGNDPADAINYKNYHIKQVGEEVSEKINRELSDLYEALNDGNLEEINNLREEYPDGKIDIGCGTITIPHKTCEDIEADCASFDYEAYFYDYWNAKEEPNYDLYAEFSKNELEVAAGAGDINELFKNMKESGYNCLRLKQCWMGIVTGYKSNIEAAAADSDLEYNMLKSLLSCTGTMYVDAEETPSINTLHEAHKYFKYTKGSNPDCEKAIFKDLLTNLENAGNYPLPDVKGADLETHPQNLKWKQFYVCVTTPEDMDYSETPNRYENELVGKCNKVCDDRYGSFKEAVIKEYHENNKYVEGDQFELEFHDENYGPESFSFNYEKELNIPSSEYIPMEAINCASQNLVEHCMDYCAVDFEYNQNGQITWRDNVDEAGNLVYVKDEHNNDVVEQVIITNRERARIEKAVLSDFEIEFTTDGACTVGFEKVTANFDESFDFNPTMDQHLVKLWDRTYGGSHIDYPKGSTSTADGNFLVYGYTSSSAEMDVSDPVIGGYGFGMDIWLMKVDKMGNKIWDKSYGTAISERNMVVTEGPNGNIFIATTSDNVIDTSYDRTARNLTGKKDIWVLQLNKSGDILNDFAIGSNQYDYVVSDILFNEDEELIVLGNQIQPTGKSLGVLFVCDYVNSSVVDGEVFGENIELNNQETENATFTSFYQDTDGTYKILGHVKSAGETDYKLRVLNVDLSLTNSIVSNTALGGDNDETSYKIKKAKDGNILIAGVTKSNNTGDVSANNGGTHMWILKLNASNQSIIWQKTLGGIGMSECVSGGVDLQEKANGNIIAITTMSCSLGGDVTSGYTGVTVNPDTWTVTLSGNGDILGDSRLGGYQVERGMSIEKSEIENTSENYLILSMSSSSNLAYKSENGKGRYDFWLIGMRDYCDFAPICFKWKPQAEIPEEWVIDVTPMTCEEEALEFIQSNIEAQVGKILQDEVANIAKQYEFNCKAPTSIADELTLDYEEALFHYTLYYYDRAGNLTKTVSPEGVDESSTSRLDHPNHGFETEYAYNSLKQLVNQNTPDGGETAFLYDDISTLRYSQNAQQKIDGTFSYNKYDELMRIVEVGQSNEGVNPGSGINTIINQVENKSFPTSGIEQVVYTVYSDPAVYDGLAKHPTLGAQKNLKNRMSYAYTDEGAYTVYSYDIHGNVKWLQEEVPELGKNYISYEYDLLSKAVQRVDYNEGRSDEFHHYYKYDDQGRLTDVYTGRYKSPLLTPQSGPSAPLPGELPKGEGLREIDQNKIVESELSTLSHDAHYDYYKHGPVRRTELGDDKIQGLDIVYTLQGWLKSINHPSLETSLDVGNDGGTGSQFAKDVFGSTLSYFANDFNRTGSQFNSSNSKLLSSNGITNELYNGNIASWTSNVGNSIVTPELSGNNYRYDHLNRIKKADFSRHLGSGWVATNHYDSKYEYDANGNLLHLDRNAHGGNSGKILMDDIDYTYHAGTNRLKIITDQGDQLEYEGDIDNHTHNYQYDAVGNLVKDEDEGINEVKWLANGKIDYVQKADGVKIDFVYNAFGNRVAKKVTTISDEKVTFYVTDPSGNVMSNYERKENAGAWDYYQTEMPIIGSKREGVYNTYEKVIVKTIGGGDLNLNCVNCNDIHQVTYTMNQLYGRAGYETKWTRELHHRKYELADHLGNVRGVVSDRKISTGEAELISVSNVYPYGMLQPGRTHETNEYRYGFNGMEKDDEHSQGKYNFGARIFDARLGRWLAIDPLASKYPDMAPFIFAGSSPILYLDPNGEEIVDANGNKMVLNLKEEKGVWSVSIKTNDGSAVPTNFTNNAGILLNDLVKTPKGREMYKKAVNSKRKIHLTRSPAGSPPNTDALGLTITDYNIKQDGTWVLNENTVIQVTVFAGAITTALNSPTDQLNGQGFSQAQAEAQTTGHELEHALQGSELKGKNAKSKSELDADPDNVAKQNWSQEMTKTSEATPEAIEAEIASQQLSANARAAKRAASDAAAQAAKEKREAKK